jgi:hypothetical protein
MSSSGLINGTIPQVYSSVPSPAQLRPHISKGDTHVKVMPIPKVPEVKAPKATTLRNGFKKPATPPHYGWLLPHGF